MADISKPNPPDLDRIAPDLRRLLRSTGWVPDPPHPGDHTHEHPDIKRMLKPTGLLARKLRKALPKKVDHRRYCSPVQYQGQYNTCTAHVVAGMLAFQQNRAHGSYVPASRLFLFRVTKRLLNSDEVADGVYFRQMMGCLVLVGVPPESYFPYLDTAIDDDPRLDAEPDAFCYAVAADHQATRYIRLDPAGEEPQAVLDRVRGFLAAGFSMSIGFPLIKSALKASKTTGLFNMPAPKEEAIGRHAVLLVGYDDELVVPGVDGGPSATGALLFKNSWDMSWGDQGYGWLPYDYLLQGWCHDVWTLIQSEWVDTDQFKIDWDEPLPTPPGRDG